MNKMTIYVPEEIECALAEEASKSGSSIEAVASVLLCLGVTHTAERGEVFQDGDRKAS